MSGRIHRVVNLGTLVLPSMKLESCFFTICSVPFFGVLWFCICGLWFYAFWRFEHFGHFTKVGPHGVMCIFIGVGLTPILYIYSLRHFLTTKGALIDGDGYPPKNPKNDPKNHSKMIKIWLKLMSKNDQKQCFLMAKSSFSPFFT